jgi:hypothetical protein
MGVPSYGGPIRLIALSIAGLLFATPAYGAAAPKRECGSRAEGGTPIRHLPNGADDVRVGPVAFMGLRKVAEPGSLAPYRHAPSGRYLFKTPLFVREGRFVSVTVSGIEGGEAGLTFASRSLRGVPRVRFQACDRDEPAFSYDGPVGAVTAFAGGFSVSKPTCLIIRVRVRGDRAYSTSVPIGIGICGRA